MSLICSVSGGGPSGTSTVGLVEVSTSLLEDESSPPVASEDHDRDDRADRQDAEEDQLVAFQSGMFPCFRFGCSTRLVCSVRRARISFGRVWRGSITSSM